jgi:prophage maintenance system killer protein
LPPHRAHPCRRRACRQSLFQYDDADLIRQAALLAAGISQNQPFVDDNKRTAFAACDLFPRMNGHGFAEDPLEPTKRLEMVAEHAGRLDEAINAFERWLRGNIRTD